MIIIKKLKQFLMIIIFFVYIKIYYFKNFSTSSRGSKVCCYISNFLLFLIILRQGTKNIVVLTYKQYNKKILYFVYLVRI